MAQGEKSFQGIQSVLTNPETAGSVELASAMRSTWREIKDSLPSEQAQSFGQLVQEGAYRVEHSQPSKTPSNIDGKQYGPRTGLSGS